MSRLTWGNPENRLYEAGLDRGVLYVEGEDGVPWDGLKAVDQSPAGGEVKSYYLDGVNYANVSSVESFKASITALYSPPEFDACDGVGLLGQGLFATQQRRKTFGLSYRTKVGGEKGIDQAYKIHVIYNALAAPSSRSYSTLTDQTEPVDLSWDLTTRPVRVPNGKPTSHFIIDTARASEAAVQQIEDILYGSDGSVPRLPTAYEIITLFEGFALLIVTDNNDGTFTIDGPDSVIQMVSATQFQITWDTAVYLNPTTYRISSF